MSVLQFEKTRFNKMIATGGIGSGFYFALDGNHDLGRNETRMGRRLPGRDYCKQHIISHYVSTFLGDHGTVYAIGAVGDDSAGQILLKEMQGAGIDTQWVKTCASANTLYAVCFQYPDSSGGNITEADSACAEVSEVDVESCLNALAEKGQVIDEKTIILAVSEVPLQTRLDLLRRGTDAGAFCIASVCSDETHDFIAHGGIKNTDLLAINSDEARACIPGCNLDGAELAQAVYEKLKILNKDIILSVTLGKEGAVVITDNIQRYFEPILSVVKSSGGAGDAYTAGVILALWAGMPIERAPQLGILLSSHSVTSFDTINFDSNPQTLADYAREKDIHLSSEIQSLLGE